MMNTHEHLHTELSRKSMRFAGWDRVAAFACGSQLAGLAWEYEAPVPGMYTALCAYEPARGAWATCVDQVLREHFPGAGKESRTFAESVKYANVACQKAGGGLIELTPDIFVASLRNASSYIRDIANATERLTFPVRLEDKSRMRVVNGVHAEFLNLDRSNDSVLWVYYYFLALLLSISLFQLDGFRQRCVQIRFVNWLRARFQLPTMWHTEKHAQRAKWALGGLVPTSLEATIILGFFIAHTIALCANYSIDPEEILEEAPMQWLQALGNRSGILCFGLLPLIIVFSTRNNFVQKFTGLRYTSFLALHRWIGRIITADALIHTAAFYIHDLMSGAIDVTRPQLWWKAGVAGSWICIFISLLAMGAFRSRWYETFLYTHIILALLFFGLCWVHVKAFGWTSWIWLSCIIWAAERALRVYSMTVNGIGHADVRLENEHLLVLTVPKPKNWREHPTQYAFVYFLLPSIFWQSHPLTLMSTGGELKAVISAKNGATAILQRTVQKLNATGRAAKIPICLEGPYGISPSLTSTQKLLFIAGGSGIPGPLSMCRSLIGSKQDLHLVVVVRDLGLLEAYRDELCYVIESQEVKVDVHYTGRTNGLHDLVTKRSRPDLLVTIGRLFENKSAAAVVCCGPPVLNDQVRNIVAQGLENHPSTPIELFEEFQVW